MPSLGVATVARPKFDVATDYGHYYMGLAIDYMRSRGMQVRDLDGPDATKLNIDASLDEDDPIFCYWLGHGNADTYTCQNQEIYMRTCHHNERKVLAGFIFRYTVAYWMKPTKSAWKWSFMQTSVFQMAFIQISKSPSRRAS